MSTSPRPWHLLDTVRAAAVGHDGIVPVDYPRDRKTKHAYTWFEKRRSRQEQTSPIPADAGQTTTTSLHLGPNNDKGN